MDINKYISSGILEAYALGDLTLEERKEVELMVSRYPEIKAELAMVEETLESIAFHTAVAPKENLKDNILQKAFSQEPKTTAKVVKTEKEAIPLHPEARRDKKTAPGTYKYLLAAAITLAVLSSAAAAFFWNKWQDAENQLYVLAMENTRMADQFQHVNLQLEAVSEELAVYSGVSFNRIFLEGQPTAPDANAIVFWNKESGDVYLNPSSLPTPPAGKQYQLWAIVGDQPVDIGLVTEDKNGSLLKMKEVENAAAFAITLEPSGGSSSPTLDQMYVLGTTS